MLRVVEWNRDFLFKTEAFKNRMPVSTVASGELWEVTEPPSSNGNKRGATSLRH